MLRFPDSDTLRLALTSGAIPSTVGDTSATASFEDGGAVWVRPSKPLSRSTLAELKRLGVRVDPTAEVALDQPVCCWAQLLPLRRDPSTETPSGTTPVFFELAGAELPDLVGEVLRLGNDRQSFRWLDDGERARALLRVVGPPYYALLRALERGRDDSAPRAYVEKSPRVLVELGHTHPFLDRLQPPPGHLLLMRAPRGWTFLNEGTFRDIYEVLEFRLPAEPVRARDVEPPRRLSVPLRLARGSATDPAELWVIRDRAEEQLDALVRDADDRLLARLAFAVAGGKRRGRADRRGPRPPLEAAAAGAGARRGRVPAVSPAGEPVPAGRVAAAPPVAARRRVAAPRVRPVANHLARPDGWRRVRPGEPPRRGVPAARPVGRLRARPRASRSRCLGPVGAVRLRAVRLPGRRRRPEARPDRGRGARQDGRSRAGGRGDRRGPVAPPARPAREPPDVSRRWRRCRRSSRARPCAGSARWRRGSSPSTPSPTPKNARSSGARWRC